MATFITLKANVLDDDVSKDNKVEESLTNNSEEEEFGSAVLSELTEDKESDESSNTAL